MKAQEVVCLHFLFSSFYPCLDVRPFFTFTFTFTFNGVHLSGCHLFPFSCHLALSSPVLEFSHQK